MSQPDKPVVWERYLPAAGILTVIAFVAAVVFEAAGPHA
jgi:hypothetical protein